MGEAASILQRLSCQDCARYVCNNAEIHSRCCAEDGCSCDAQTHETTIQDSHEDIEVAVEGSSIPWLCCNCLFKHHK